MHPAVSHVQVLQKTSQMIPEVAWKEMHILAPWNLGYNVSSSHMLVPICQRPISHGHCLDMQRLCKVVLGHVPRFSKFWWKRIICLNPNFLKIAQLPSKQHCFEGKKWLGPVWHTTWFTNNCIFDRSTTKKNICTGIPNPNDQPNLGIGCWVFRHNPSPSFQGPRSWCKLFLHPFQASRFRCEGLTEVWSHEEALGLQRRASWSVPKKHHQVYPK